MAKRKIKSPEVKQFDEKKEEVVYDFGEVKICTSWDDVTLQMMCDFLRIKAEKEELLEKDKKEAERNKEEFDETLEKYNVTDKDLLKCFSDIDEEKIDLLPVELYERLMANLAFIVNKPLDYQPAKTVEVNGKKLIINDMDGLKVKEFKDADSVMHSDKYDYPSLLAILCREQTGIKTDHATGFSWAVNEDYNDEFANKVFDSRRYMFANMPVKKAMPLIAFFFAKSMTSLNIFQKSLQTNAHLLNELAQNLGNSINSTDLPLWKRLSVNMTLIKLKKQIRDFS